ncbi:hypothetical protein [Lactiplantibacillus modestisalitolerans]|uniref:AMP-dependent synthetase/ligase domain-containing protein n=1 Tax=Lactiplantibacillus modestisalitolerans TaxID=1457219 RepID=A0ABV5WU35_9LACO|nr:hypothetical protein [Lactiplantibacillus modestisalitolerans]
MSQLTAAILNQLQTNYHQPVLRLATGNWFTGADLLEDIQLCRTSLGQQQLQAGQTILLSPTQPAVIPGLLIASWQLGLTVTLTPPSSHQPDFSPQAYAAMVFSPSQTTRLAHQLDPQQISALTLILNTAPHFTYFVHDNAETLTRHSRPDLILPADQRQLTQAELYQQARATAPTATCVINVYDYQHGLLPCLGSLLAAQPVTIKVGSVLAR